MLSAYIALFFFAFVQLISCGQLQAHNPQPAARGVSHEDIRNGILSLGRMSNYITDKLERHENRERELGEKLEKAFLAIEEKLKTEDGVLATISDLLSGIEKRIHKLENTPNKVECSGDSDSKESQAALTSLEQLVQTKFTQLDQSVKENQVNFNSLKGAAVSKLDYLSASVDKIETQLKELENKFNFPVTTQSPDFLATVIASQVDKKVSEILTRLQEWQQSFSTSVDAQQVSSDQVRTLSGEILDYVKSSLKKEDLADAVNATIQSIQETKYDVLLNAEKGVTRLQDKISKIQEELSLGQENILKAVNDDVITTDLLHKDVQRSYEQLSKEIQSISQVEQVLIQTADNVLDIKRRIEYGTHQILLEVSEMVKQETRDMNATVNKRFDSISATILDNQNGGLTNLSSKIETEISQVWRQIGIMYQTLTASANALDRLQNQTEIYVNGSLTTMDHMEGKVGLITSRMTEVDDNLNYLLGRLSLVTQEFNQIKTGLGEALDQIRSSFHTVQEKVKDVGPGPNPIPNEEELEGGAVDLKNTKYITS